MSITFTLVEGKDYNVRGGRAGARTYCDRNSRGCWKLTRPGAMSQSRLTRSWSFGFQRGGVDGQALRARMTPIALSPAKARS